MRIFVACVLSGLVMTACRTKGPSSEQSAALDSTSNPQVIVRIQEASTAGEIFSVLKKWDQSKSSATSRVYEGRGDLQCSVMDDETTCSMTTGVARDYIFNFGGLNASIMNDLWVATPVVGAGITSKNAQGKLRMTVTKSEFKVELLGQMAPIQPFILVKDPRAAKGIFERLKDWNKAESTATSRVYKGPADLTCELRDNEQRCWMVVVAGAKKEYIFNFSDEHADYITLSWGREPEVIDGVPIKRVSGMLHMVATGSQFLLQMAE